MSLYKKRIRKLLFHKQKLYVRIYQKADKSNVIVLINRNY